MFGQAVESVCGGGGNVRRRHLRDSTVEAKGGGEGGETNKKASSSKVQFFSSSLCDESPKIRDEVEQKCEASTTTQYNNNVFSCCNDRIPKTCQSLVDDCKRDTCAFLKIDDFTTNDDDDSNIVAEESYNVSSIVDGGNL